MQEVNGKGTLLPAMRLVRNNTSRIAQDALLCDMELPFHGVFYPLGYGIEIFANDLEVLNAARESFGHACPSRGSSGMQIRVGVCKGGSNSLPEPKRHEYNHLFSLVADVDNQALLDLKTCSSFVWLTQAALSNRLYFRYNFLEKTVYLLLGASVVTDLHAACVSKNGKGILLCGESGAGKSTLAYACARSGWTYTSDDTSYLINESTVPRVIGHSHRARFRPAASALFPELKGRELTPRLEGKPSLEVPITELPVKNAAPEATVDSIVYLNRHSSAAAQLIRLPDGTATSRMSRELYSAGEIRKKHEQILKVFWTVPTYELRYCALADGMEMLDSLARSR